MNILIADDHDLVRETIPAYLDQTEGISATTARDLDEALHLIGGSGQFDLVLLDHQMPGMNGLARALEVSGGRPVALISGMATRSIAEEALAADAAGFLPKTMAAKSMVNAVRFIAMGETYAPLDFTTGEEGGADSGLCAALSERERQVLNGLCRGLSNKEIARERSLQEVTIKLHVKTLCRKLDARNRAHAAMIAREAGLA